MYVYQEIKCGDRLSVLHQLFFWGGRAGPEGAAHLFVAQVSLVEGDPGEFVALTDVEHRHGVASVHQLLHQVSPQEAGPPDDRAPLTALYGGQ